MVLESGIRGGWFTIIGGGAGSHVVTSTMIGVLKGLLIVVVRLILVTCFDDHVSSISV